MFPPRGSEIHLAPRATLNTDMLSVVMVDDSVRSKRKVEIRVTKKGEKLKFVEMAEKNARITLENKVKGKYNVLLELKEALKLDRFPNKIECYDISNISGTFIVAGMCVVKNGEISKRDSRRFRIKSVDDQNDALSMNEVIFRRLSHSNTQCTSTQCASTQCTHIRYDHSPLPGRGVFPPRWLGNTPRPSRYSTHGYGI